MNLLYVKKLHPNAVLPHYAHPGEDAAFDLYCLDDFMLESHELKTVSIGLAIQIPKGYFGHILERSGLSGNGVALLGGVIDSGYRGEWKINILNTTECINILFRAGDKIAQCAIIPVPEFQIVETDTLTESARGEKGFGSTDKNVPYRKLHAP